MTTPTRRRDESMTLLHEVMQRPLDPGYAMAARRRRENPDGARARRRQGPVTLLLAALAGAMLVVAVVHLRVPATDNPRDVLIEEIDVRTAEADRLAEQAAALRTEIDGIGAGALSGQGQAVVDRSRLLGVVTGAASVVGSGVRVELDNAETTGDVSGRDPRQRELAERGRVRDRDLQIVVNGLWAAGAEAVAVNGQRLTALSSIREAGAAILVNFRPLSPPYEVLAIGDPQALQVELATSAAGRYLSSLQQNYGVRASVAGADALELPGASGQRLRYAESVTPSGTPTTQSGAASLSSEPAPPRQSPSEDHS